VKRLVLDSDATRWYEPTARIRDAKETRCRCLDADY
jgi:hypothetical protein